MAGGVSGGLSEISDIMLDDFQSGIVFPNSVLSRKFFELEGFSECQDNLTCIVFGNQSNGSVSSEHSNNSLESHYSGTVDENDIDAYLEHDFVPRPKQLISVDRACQCNKPIMIVDDD